MATLRVLCAFVGGAGHADPLVPVAMALRETGHEVAFHGRRSGAGTAIGRGFPLFVGPRLPVLASLEGLVTWMLQPRRPQPRQEIDVEPVDAADVDAELRRYPPEVRAAAGAFLDAEPAWRRQRLSRVLRPGSRLQQAGLESRER